MQVYQKGRRLSIVAGALASIGALGILLNDPITTGQWRLDHALLPILVIITIAAGHLVGSAIGSRKILSAFGFVVVFALGTMLTIYSSVGSQTASSGDKALSVEAHNKALADKRTGLASKRAEYRAATDAATTTSAALHTQCIVGKASAKHCDSIRGTLRMLEASAKGHASDAAALEADLAKLGGEKIARPKAAAFAEAAEVFGFDRRRTEHAATILEPFAYSLILELMAIAAFGYGLGGTIAMPSVRKLREKCASETVLEHVPEPPKGRRVRKLNQTRERTAFTQQAARADIIRLVQGGGTVPRQQVLAERWGVPPGTVSRWLTTFEGEGIVARPTDGRCRLVKAA